MKKGYKVLLWVVGSLIATPILIYLGIAVFYFIDCAAPFKHHYQTLDCGNGRRLEIVSDTIDIEYSETYLRAYEEDRTIIPETRFDGVGNYHRHYIALTNGPSHMVAVVERFMESNILAIVDFASGEHWVLGMTNDPTLAHAKELIARFAEGTDAHLVLGDE